MSYVAAVSCLPWIGPTLKLPNKGFIESSEIVGQMTQQITDNETPNHKKIYQYALYQFYCRAPFDVHLCEDLEKNHPNYLTDVLRSPDTYSAAFLSMAEADEDACTNAATLLKQGIEVLNKRKPLVICGIIGHILTIASLVSLIAMGILTGPFCKFLGVFYALRLPDGIGLVVSWLTVDTERAEASTFAHKHLMPAFQIPASPASEDPHPAPL